MNSAIAQKKMVKVSAVLSLCLMRNLTFREIAPAAIDAEIIRKANVFCTVSRASTWGRASTDLLPIRVKALMKAIIGPTAGLWAVGCVKPSAEIAPEAKPLAVESHAELSSDPNKLNIAIGLFVATQRRVSQQISAKGRTNK